MGDRGVSAKTIERVVHDVGRELAERRDADPKTDDALAQRPQAPPEWAVVECDGGRIRTREPGHGPGVHRTAEGWRETKNACLIRGSRTISDQDPQPEPPACFCDPKHVAKIAETAALSVASAQPAPVVEVPEKGSPEPAGLVTPAEWHPRRLVRTVLGSIAESKDFGKQMAREAKRRRFAEAPAKAFLGDGLAWNWSIWKQHFPDFTPILDFLHVLSYRFLAAKAVHDVASDAWAQYLVDLDGQVLPLRRQESVGRPGDRIGDRSEVRLRETEGRRSLTVHARFLRVGRGIESPAPIWRERAFWKTPFRSTACYLVLNQAEMRTPARRLPLVATSARGITRAENGVAGLDLP